MNSAHYRTPLEGKNCGRGVASGFWFNGGGKSSVSASVNPDGRVNLLEGSTDIGGSRAAIAMQLAETLGISAEDINPRVVDTDSVGYNDGTGGSASRSLRAMRLELGLGCDGACVRNQRNSGMFPLTRSFSRVASSHVRAGVPHSGRPLRNWQASMCRLSPAYRLAFGRRAWLCHAHRRRGS